MTISKPPEHLSMEARATWRRFHRLYQLGTDCHEIMVELLEATDRKRQAQEILKREGLTLTNRFGVQAQHPAAAVERDCRVQVLRCLRMLGLPLEAERQADKPPRWSGGRKKRHEESRADMMAEHERRKRELTEDRTQ